MRALWLASAIVALAGCISSGTTHARHAAADALARSLAPPTSTNRRSSEPTAAASCDAIARAVVLAHPHLVAARERVRAALARSDAAGALPPPTVGLEVWSFPIGDPSQADHRGTYIARVGEVLPPGGALDGRARAEAEDARAQVATIAEHAADVRAEVLDACMQWSAAEDVRVHLVAYRDLVTELHDALVARTSPGSVGDIVRADAEIAMAERRVMEAEAGRDEKRAMLDALVAGSTPLPGSPPPLPATGDVPDAPLMLHAAIASRGLVSAANARVEQARAEARAAQAEADVPTFEVGASYMQDPAAPAGLGAMVAMTLPWLSNGGAARARAATHEAEAARAETADAARTVRIEVVTRAARVRSLLATLDAITRVQIPAERRALDAVRATLASGAFDLVAWIQAAEALATAEVDASRTRGELAVARVALDRAVGGTTEGALRDE